MHSPSLSGSLFESPTILSPGSLETAPPAEVFSSTLLHPLPRTSHPARLALIYSLLFFLPILGALAINSFTSPTGVLAKAMNRSAAVSPLANTTLQQDYQSAVQASASTPANAATDFAYELSLSTGFLKKAITLSNTSTADSQEQTVEQKQQIIEYLNQALESATRAIALLPTDARGYSARGRVYQTISAIKPEMQTLADQDFTKASQLGATAPTQEPTSQEPTELLPTQQATNTLADKAIVAGPEEAQTSTMSTETTDNAKKGTATLEAGQTNIFVPYPSVSDTTQLYVTAKENIDNTTLYVKNKEAGVGFTIAATAAPSTPLTIDWWEIQ